MPCRRHSSNADEFAAAKIASRLGAESPWVTGCASAVRAAASAPSLLRVLRRGEAGRNGALDGRCTHLFEKPRRTAPARLLVEHRYHTPVTDCVDSPGPKRSDLELCGHLGLTWTPTDGLYNLCHVVPQDSHANTSEAVRGGLRSVLAVRRGPGVLLRHCQG